MIMLKHKMAPRLRQTILDFSAALALFWLAILGLSGPHSSAYAIALPPLAAAAAQLEAPAGSVGVDAAGPGPRLSLRREAPGTPRPAFVLLSITVAAIAAFNLAFWRHLRRVYASQRRGVWRRN
jgi:hypothetical protein